MEFIPVEVYSNESLGRGAVGRGGPEHVEKGPSVHNQAAPEVDGPYESGARNISNRLPLILSPDALPPITDKATAFESFRVVADKGVFAGRHDGTIFHWKVQQSSSVTPLNLSQLRGHTGAVLALEFSASLGKDGLLFSGAADRSIKVWDPWRGSEAEQQLHGDRHDHFCVQTLPAHQASVTCLRLLTQHQRPGLVSCSLDHTIKVWFPAEGRGLLMYPWFVAAQTITMSSTDCWPTSLCIRNAAMSCSLFVGDSAGHICHYTSGVSTTDDEPLEVAATRNQPVTHSTGLSSRVHFKLKRKYAQFHALGVLSLELVCENNFVVSLGYDQKAHVLDAMSGSVTSTISNRNATRFTSCAWDARGGQWLFLADAMGYVHVWNVFEDKWVKKEKVVPRGTPLMYIHLHPASDWLFAGVANMMKQWKIDRDVGYGECTGHADAIVGFAVLRDEVLLDQNQHDVEHRGAPMSSAMATSSRFFSVSLDNTLRCWDAYDMKAAFGFEERQSEVTCVATSKKFSKLVTGHEGGFLKAWSIYTGQYVVAPLPSKSAVTCLTTGMVRDQEFVFASDVDGNLFLWELSADSLSFTATAHVALSNDPTRRDEISAVFFCKGDYLSLSGGSEFLVVGYQTGHLAIWSFHKKLVLKAWKGHDDAVSSICRHGCFVFTGSDDTTVRIWNCFNLKDPYELGVLRSPGERSSSGTGSAIVAVDVVQPSGAVLCAAADGTVSVWDYTDYDDKAYTDYESYGKLVHRIHHNHQLRCMQYWPGREAALCGSSEGRVLVLALPPHAVAPRALAATSS